MSTVIMCPLPGEFRVSYEVARPARSRHGQHQPADDITVKITYTTRRDPSAIGHAATAWLAMLREYVRQVGIFLDPACRSGVYRRPPGHRGDEFHMELRCASSRGRNTAVIGWGLAE